MFMALSTDMTDDEIKACIHDMHPVCMANKQGFILTISGYDDDPRDIWDIPEAVQFAKRLIDIGLVSYLETATIELSEQLGTFVGFGALELWMVATGRMKIGNNMITPKEIKQAYEVQLACNKKCEEILKQPRPNVDRDKFTKQYVKEGQNLWNRSRN